MKYYEIEKNELETIISTYKYLKNLIEQQRVPKYNKQVVKALQYVIEHYERQIELGEAIKFNLKRESDKK